MRVFMAKGRQRGNVVVFYNFPTANGEFFLQTAPISGKNCPEGNFSASAAWMPHWRGSVPAPSHPGQSVRKTPVCSQVIKNNNISPLTPP